jgi:hypothetical protein
VLAGSGAGDDALRWQLLFNYRNGSYRIRHAATGKCLALATISKQSVNPVVAEDYSALPHQEWFLDPVVDQPNQFRIINGYSGLALESQGSSGNGTSMIVTAINPESALQQWRVSDDSIHYPKKGIAATSSIPNPTFADPTISAMEHYFQLIRHSSWSYSWGRQRSDEFPFMGFDHAFNPMQWGNFNFEHNTNRGPLDRLRPDLQSNARPVSLMGFNEPDGAKQANMTVATAIARWPRLDGMDVPLVSPGPVNIPNAWLNQFYDITREFGYRVDYSNAHWYKAPSASALISDMENAYNIYGRPIWLTEFSVVRWTGSAQWTHSDNYEFLAEFMWRAESLPWLARYSLFHFRESADGPNQSAADPVEAPRSNSIRADGSLTPFGELYASWDGVAEILPLKAYHLHNLGSYERGRQGDDSALEMVSLEAGRAGTQWFLAPGETSGTYRVISLLNGRPLRLDSQGNVTLAESGQIDSSVEWKLVEDAHGRFFIEHPATGSRLRSTDGGFTTVPAATTGNRLKWRLIPPLHPEPVITAVVPDELTATPGVREIALAWAVPEPSDVERSTVYRSDSPAGPFTEVVAEVTDSNWTDTGLTPETTYYYAIRSLTTSGLQSDLSSVAEATTLHAFATYESWVEVVFPDASEDDTSPQGNPDGDALINLLEYAFLTNPTRPDGTQFTISRNAEEAIQLHFPWNRHAIDYAWRIRHGHDLTDPTPWPIADIGQVETVTEDDIDQTTVTLPPSLEPRAFFILEIHPTNEVP